MSVTKRYVISDLHLGHANILKHSGALRGGTTAAEHEEWIIHQWNSVVTKHDLTYVLGDAAFNRQALHLFKKLKGTKHLCKGNHDIESLKAYQEYFGQIYGIHNYRRVFWMTHAPIHPGSLRGMYNLHGHTHQNKVLLDKEPDLRYINVCVESSFGVPQNLDDLFDKYAPLVAANRKGRANEESEDKPGGPPRGS